MRLSTSCILGLLILTSISFADTPTTQATSGITVKTLMDGSHELVSGVQIKWDSNDGRGEGQTAANGEYAITGLTRRCASLIIEVSHPGMVPLDFYWQNKHLADSDAPLALPPVLFLMENTTRIGGKLVDEHGQPIPGGTVVVSAKKKYPGSEQRVDIRWKSTTAGADGAWSFDGFPANASVRLGAYDFGHLEGDYFDLHDYQPVADLYQGAGRLTLPTGTLVHVIVLKPDGSPAPGTKLFVGRSTRIVDKYPWAKTDAKGEFTFGCKPGMNTMLTAISSKYGPAQSALSVSNKPQQIILRLTPTAERSIDVVDSRGKPIADAMVIVTSWQSSDTLGIQLKTDKAGHGDWNGGPPDDVTAEILTHAAQKEITWSAGKPMRVVLHPPIQFAGIVTDAATHQPISKYTAHVGAICHEGERLVWQSFDFDSMGTIEEPGKFITRFDIPSYRYVLRVQADGYLPVDTEPFDPDGPARTFDFALAKAAPITGQLLTSSNQPAAGADVYISYVDDCMSLWDGRIQPGLENDYPHVQSGTDGRFVLPPQKDDFSLVVVSDYGSAILRKQALEPNAIIHLMPWAALQGTIFVGGKPAANIEIYGNSPNVELADGTPVVTRSYHFKTDENGHFQISRLFPGSLILNRVVSNHAPGRSWFIAAGTMDVEAGKNYTEHFGEGLAVSGQLQIPPDKPWMIRESRIEPTGQPHRPNFDNVEVLDDGHFRADGLSPGTYSLRIALHEFPPANDCGWGRVVGEYNKEITLLPNASTTDVGTIAPDPITGPDLQVGDVMPDIEVDTLDGRPLRISDFKGKVLLVDFWATWCAPCVAEIPNLKSIAAAHAHDVRFAMLSLSEDEKAANAMRFAKVEAMPWPQAWVGTDSPSVKTCGASAIPASFLIGPDGRIIARNLRGQDLQNAVEAALRK